MGRFRTMIVQEVLLKVYISSSPAILVQSLEVEWDGLSRIQQILPSPISPILLLRPVARDLARAHSHLEMTDGIHSE